MAARLFHFSLLLLASTVFCFADDLAEARRAEEAGNRRGALELYEYWIRSHPQDEQMAEVIQRSSLLLSRPQDALDFMERYEHLLPQKDQAEFWAHMAALESMIGRPQRGVMLYEKAAQNGVGEEQAEWLLEALALKLAMGEEEAVARRAGNLALELDAGPLGDRAAAMAAEALNNVEGPLAALQLLEQREKRVAAFQIPDPLFTRWRIFKSSGQGDEAQQVWNQLNQQFPQSTLTYLASEQIEPWLEPRELLAGPDLPSGNVVQAGAFSNREGAAALRDQLEEEEFTAWMEQSGAWWRVYVHDEDGTAQDRLKKSGYDPLSVQR
ncbi:MAG: SPOR domain-containing protein [Spirochaetales bacterium]|nr:SPOR domain-containing protein [Spirochaetales bacterium]